MSGGFAGALPFVGPVIGAAGDLLGQQSANRANRRMAREQMQFQERMRDTEMQARVKDLIKAGLNPMLAVSQGGASSPGGARAEAQSVTGGRLAERITSAVMLKAQLANVSADTNLKNSAAAVNAATVPQLGAATAHQMASAGQATSQAKVLEAQVGEIASRIRHLETQITGQGLTNQLAQRVMDATVRLKAADAKAAELGLPRRDVVAQGATALGDVVRKAPGVLRSIGEALGGSAADAKEWLQDLLRRSYEAERSRGIGVDSETARKLRDKRRRK